VTTYLPLSGLVDLEAEKQKLGRELAETEAQIERSRALLAGPFAQRAPAAVVQREHEKLAELHDRAGSLKERLADLS
jgi:valyl-tRNA synthetase